MSSYQAENEQAREPRIDCNAEVPLPTYEQATGSQQNVIGFKTNVLRGPRAAEQNARSSRALVPRARDNREVALRREPKPSFCNKGVAVVILGILTITFILIISLIIIKQKLQLSEGTLKYQTNASRKLKKDYEDCSQEKVYAIKRYEAVTENFMDEKRRCQDQNNDYIDRVASLESNIQRLNQRIAEFNDGRAYSQMTYKYDEMVKEKDRLKDANAKLVDKNQKLINENKMLKESLETNPTATESTTKSSKGFKVDMSRTNKVLKDMFQRAGVRCDPAYTNCKKILGS